MSTIGFYDSFAQYIELSTVSSDELRIALAGTDPTIGVRVLPLLVHELQHWGDHLSTLAGRVRLVRAIEAMEARVADDPTQFWRVIAYLRAAEADCFTTYYQTVNSLGPQHGPTRPWTWELNSGMRFSADGLLAQDRPIFFTRFSWPDGTIACRVPFSVSALFEARAMAAEMVMHVAAASKLPEDEALVELAMASQRQLDRLYEPRLAVYSAGAHLIGNVVGLNDAMRAFRFASQLAHVCLDLPSEMFTRLTIPEAFAPWKERVPAALSARDRGFAFLVLTHHGADVPLEHPEQWLEQTVRRGGLPSLSEVRASSTAECTALRSAAVSGRFDKRLQHLWDQGDAIRKSHTYTDSFGSPGGEVPLPPVYCNDLAWVLPKHLASQMTTDDMEEWWKSCNRIATQIEEFRHACGT